MDTNFQSRSFLSYGFSLHRLEVLKGNGDIEIEGKN